MSSALHTLARVFHTPLTQLVRGRLAPTKRDLADQLASSGLPESTRQLIATVVKRSHLWRSEQGDVQAELIAHFQDGIDAGATHDELLRKFGDAETSAKLIRRAKIRNRPMWWHIRRFAFRAMLVVIAVYALLFVQYWMGRPTVKVDYVAKLNAPILALPESDRAWPIYREVIRELIAQEKTRTASKRPDAPTWDDVLFARPGETGFAALTEYVTANRALIDQIGVAARKRDSGFIYGPGGSADEPGNPWNRVWMPPDAKVIQFTPEENRLAGESLYFVMLPNLNHAREMASILCADARVAASQRDGARFARRIEEAIGLGTQHVRSPVLVSQLVGVGIHSLAYARLSEQLERDPALLSDEQLVALVHRMPAGRVGGDLFNLDFETDGFNDLVQRMYTDDGNGDGRITLWAPKFMSLFTAGVNGADGSPLSAIAYAAPFAVASRKELLAEHSRLIALRKQELVVPHRTLPDPTPFRQRMNELQFGSTAQVLYYMPILQMMADFSRIGITAERVFAQRDALQIVIACELHKRKFGEYPKALDALVPGFLPHLPIDPVNGVPLRYALRDGKPFVYSVGDDGDDDGGKLAQKSRAKPYASNDNAAVGSGAGIDADWILFPEPPAPPTEATTQPTTLPAFAP